MVGRLLPTPNEMMEELENLRRDLWKKYGSSWRALGGFEKMLIVNEIASIFNKYWRDDLKPLLSGKPWRSAFELLQDAIGDESRKEGRLVHQWMVGLLNTESFVERLASVILSHVR
ncbi:MAG: hypothetical protein LM590_10815 [Thermofilum sp.]|nr:hypothetical protein [Thermofilum sp.]